MSPEPIDDESLVREAKRLHERYSVEFVEDFNLCPWAARARKDGHTDVRVVVRGDAQGAFEDACVALEGLALDSQVEVGFIVFPRSALDRRAFEAFVGRLRDADAERQGGSPAMACAAFHPEAEMDTSTAPKLLPYIRRSPDPTIQVVRRSVLEAVRRPSDMGTAFLDPDSIDLAALLQSGGETKSKAPLHQRVAETNLETLRARRDEALRVLDAIFEDRARSYPSSR